MTATESLHEQLQGSPYSLPNDEHSLQLLGEMLPRAEALETRCQAVRVSLAKGLAQQVARATRASEVYESNAIEGKTPTFRETYDLMREWRLWDADAAIARYTLSRAMGSEPKVLDVVGLAAARILVDQYIADRARPLQEADVVNDG